MSKIDIDKFICSLIERQGVYRNNHAISELQIILGQQGLHYRNGEIVEIDKPQTIKFKTNDEKIYQDKSPLFQDSFDNLKKHIDFDKVDIDKMVEEYKERILISQSLTYDDLLVRTIAYKSGLIDMLKRINKDEK